MLLDTANRLVSNIDRPSQGVDNRIKLLCASNQPKFVSTSVLLRGDSSQEAFCRVSLASNYPMEGVLPSHVQISAGLDPAYHPHSSLSASLTRDLHWKAILLSPDSPDLRLPLPKVVVKTSVRMEHWVDDFQINSLVDSQFDPVNHLQVIDIASQPPLLPMNRSVYSLTLRQPRDSLLLSLHFPSDSTVNRHVFPNYKFIELFAVIAVIALGTLGLQAYLKSAQPPKSKWAGTHKHIGKPLGKSADYSFSNYKMSSAKNEASTMLSSQKPSFPSQQNTMKILLPESSMKK